jgi:hypothetical protein
MMMLMLMLLLLLLETIRSLVEGGVKALLSLFLRLGDSLVSLTLSLSLSLCVCDVKPLTLSLFL